MQNNRTTSRKGPDDRRAKIFTSKETPALVYTGLEGIALKEGKGGNSCYELFHGAAPCRALLPLLSFHCSPTNFILHCTHTNDLLPMFSYHCYPTTVLLPLFSYHCSSTIVLLPLLSHHCSPTTVLLQLSSYNCTLTAVLLPMFSYHRYLTAVFLPLFSYYCFPTTVSSCSHQFSWPIFQWQETKLLLILLLCVEIVALWPGHILAKPPSPASTFYCQLLYTLNRWPSAGQCLLSTLNFLLSTVDKKLTTL